MEDIDFSNIGRNDPCPCGSGKKYKKCCFRTNRIKQQTVKSTAKLSDFIEPKQIPYMWFKGWNTILNRREWALLFQAFFVGGPLHQKYASAEAFVEEARNHPTKVPAAGEFYLRRIRLMEEHAFIMGSLSKDDRRTSSITFEVLKITNTNVGYRLADVEQKTFEKAALNGGDPSFDDFAVITSTIEELQSRPMEPLEFDRWVTDAETGLGIRTSDLALREAAASEADGEGAASSAPA